MFQIYIPSKGRPDFVTARLLNEPHPPCIDPYVVMDIDMEEKPPDRIPFSSNPRTPKRIGKPVTLPSLFCPKTRRVSRMQGRQSSITPSRITINGSGCDVIQFSPALPRRYVPG